MADSVAASAAHKAALDTQTAQLAAAQVQTATMKAAYDKSVCDAAEERAAAAADMAAVQAQSKAAYDDVAARLDKVCHSRDVAI
jgi:hypothetical protein